jgi:predicted phosphodiesterase
MTLSLIVGDTHGNTGFWKQVFTVAAHHEVDQIIQLGDFGVWPGSTGSEFLNKLDRWAEKSGIPITVIPGNHDDWDHIDSLPESRLARPNIKVFPKVASFEQDGVKFGVVSGAVSIDRMYRTAGISWWPQEVLNFQDVEDAIDLGSVDILLTHDACSELPHWNGFIKDDPVSNENRRALQAIGEALEPGLWLHGHYHKFLEYTTSFGTKVYGLSSEPKGHQDNARLNDGTPSKWYWTDALPLGLLSTKAGNWSFAPVRVSRDTALMGKLYA